MVKSLDVLVTVRQLLIKEFVVICLKQELNNHQFLFKIVSDI